MSDAEKPQSADLKQSKTAGKAGARDAKRLKNNANRDLEAPPMPDAEREDATAQRMAHRGHGSLPPRAVKAVLRLAALGYSPGEMQAKSSLVPTRQTIYRWIADHPDFAEDYKTACRQYIDNEIRQAQPVASGWRRDAQRLRRLVRKASKLPDITGLEPWQKVQATDRMLQRTTDLLTAAVTAEDKSVHRSLQIAARQLPTEWGINPDPEVGMVIFDVGLDGTFKRHNLPGTTDGQNAKALESWSKKLLPAPGGDVVDVEAVREDQ